MIVKSPETIVLCSKTGGHSAVLPANEEIEIGEALIPAAMAAGLLGLPEPEPEDQNVDKTIETIEDALEKIIEEGKPSDFSAVTKLPKVQVVSEILGKKVAYADIRDAWTAMNMSTNGDD